MSGYKKFGYDLLPVTAGVLLALLISNAQQSWKQKQFTKQVMQTIVEEHNANIQQIDELLPKQRQTLDSLSFYAPPYPPPSAMVRHFLAFFRGCRMVRVSCTLHLSRVCLGETRKC